MEIGVLFVSEILYMANARYTISQNKPLNPHYAIGILLRSKIPSKFEASQGSLIHHNGGYASIANLQILVGFCLSLRIPIA